MGKEEILLEYWRELPPEAQDRVLETVKSLQSHYSQTNEDLDFGAPEHLKVRSIEHLNELIQEGLDSGESVEVTAEWWEEKRLKLLERISSQS